MACYRPFTYRTDMKTLISLLVLVVLYLVIWLFLQLRRALRFVASVLSWLKEEF